MQGVGRRGVAPGQALRDGRLREGRRAVRDHDVPRRRLPRPRAASPRSRSPTTSRPTCRGATSRSTRWRLALDAARSSSTRSAASPISPPGGCARRSRPRSRSSDDPLRMLRAARFVATLGFEPDAATGRARSSEMHDRLEIVSAERIRDELSKLLVADDPSPGLWLDRADAASSDEFLPELNAMQLEQDPIHRHKDVLAHTIAVVAKTSPRLQHPARGAAARRRQADDARVRAAGRDVPPPRGRRRAHGARTHARRCGTRTSSSTTSRKLVELHLRFHTYRMGWTDSAVRRYVRDAGPLLDDLNELTRCDCTTRDARKAAGARRGAWTSSRRASPSCASTRSWRRSGPRSTATQVMKFLGVAPGRIVGEALTFLLELRLDEGRCPKRGRVPAPRGCAARRESSLTGRDRSERGSGQTPSLRARQRRRSATSGPGSPPAVGSGSSSSRRGSPRGAAPRTRRRSCAARRWMRLVVVGRRRPARRRSTSAGPRARRAGARRARRLRGRPRAPSGGRTRTRTARRAAARGAPGGTGGRGPRPRRARRRRARGRSSRRGGTRGRRRRTRATRRGRRRRRRACARGASCASEAVDRDHVRALAGERDRVLAAARTRGRGRACRLTSPHRRRSASVGRSTAVVRSCRRTLDVARRASRDPVPRPRCSGHQAHSCRSGVGACPARRPSYAPAANSSTIRWASSSWYCTRRRLHEVRRRAEQRATDAAVERELRAAHRVDDDAGRVGRVPDLELELDVERHVAEVAAFQADVGPLPVVEPRHMVGRADVHAVR